MAIKVGPVKKEIKAPKGFDSLFYFALVFLVLSLSAYFFINYRIGEIKESIKTTQREIRETEERVDRFKEKEEKVMEHESVINDYIQLLERRTVLTSFLTALEKSTHSQVQFSEVNIDVSQRTARLNGVARNLEALEQQYYIFKDFSLVSETEVSPIERVELQNFREEGVEEGVSFEFALALNPEIFKYQEDTNEINSLLYP